MGTDKPEAPTEVSQITKPDDEDPPATAEEWTRSWVQEVERLRSMGFEASRDDPAGQQASATHRAPADFQSFITSTGSSDGQGAGSCANQDGVPGDSSTTVATTQVLRSDMIVGEIDVFAIGMHLIRTDGNFVLDDIVSIVNMLKDHCQT